MSQTVKNKRYIRVYLHNIQLFYFFRYKVTLLDITYFELFRLYAVLKKQFFYST